MEPVTFSEHQHLSIKLFELHVEHTAYTRILNQPKVRNFI